MIDDRLAEKVTKYTPDRQALASLRDVPIALLVAPSGTGKNAIIHYLLKKYPSVYHLLVSHTTRAPRPNNGVMERDGVNYHFIDLQQAERLLDAKRYIEANWYVGNVYGLTADEVLAAQREGKIGIDEIEAQGANDFAERLPTAKTIFIMPPSYEEWQHRLQKRYGDQKADYERDLQDRVKTAKSELQNALKHDYFYLVVNDTVERAAQQIHGIMHGRQAQKRSPEAVAIARTLLRRLQEIR